MIMKVFSNLDDYTTQTVQTFPVGLSLQRGISTQTKSSDIGESVSMFSVTEKSHSKEN